MKSLRCRNFALIIWLSLTATSIHAKYCINNSSSCCAYRELGQPTCRGVGTTDISELMYYLLRGGETYGVLGQYEGLYWVFSISYKLLPGSEAIVFLNTLYAYVIEVPNRSGGHTYYYISVTGCPYIITITAFSRGLVPGTTLPLAKVYAIIVVSNSKPNCDGPCNTITGTTPTPVPVSPFYQLNFGIPLTFSNTIAFQYNCFNERYSRAPNEAICKYGLDVQRGNCSTLYVQRGYQYGAELCYRPDRGIPLGAALRLIGFDFSKLGQINGPCLLGTAIGKLAATAPYPYYLYYEKFSLIASPYRCMITLAGYFPTSLGDSIDSPLIESLC